MTSLSEQMHAPQLKPISQIAEQLGIPSTHLIPYGHYAAKIDIKAIKPEQGTGQLVLVSSITPTPLGEGKTVTTIGLSQGLNFIGKKALACIRQPSLGPVFGVKGGAAGGGVAQVLPMEQLNLHLTGDIHAITAAHNLAAAALDARLFHEQRLGDKFTEHTGLKRLDPEHILWKRVIDHNDRALRSIDIGVGGGNNGVPRHDGFDITAASELMAILALSESLADMRQRIGRIILAYSLQGHAITTEDLEVAGAMTVLMKEAIHPTLMQTSENTPVLIHAGPFANIAHGNSSVLADRLALQLADYVVTEAGFGSDMGMEKFFNIKCRQSGIKPSCVVLVATLRSLKANSGKFNMKPGQSLPEEVKHANLPLLTEGASNLAWHIGNASRYGLPVVVAINHFPEDSAEELEFIRQFAMEHGAFGVEISDAFSSGGKGTAQLAECVTAACRTGGEVSLLYPDDMSLADKLQTLAKNGYGALRAELTPAAQATMQQLELAGFGHLPLCMAKTPLSISAAPALKNVPRDFVLPVTDLKVSAGAGFIRVYAGNIMTMPGLSTLPAYRHIDIDNDGNIVGLS